MTREEQLADLHAKFVQASGRPEPFRFHREAWQRLVSTEEYGGDVELLRRDAGFVAWYLKRAIARDKRQPGALRLRNLLVPDQFASDLAEAIEQESVKWKQHLARKAKGTAPAPTPTPAPAADEAVAKRGAASLRDFAEKLKGGTDA